MLTVLDQQLMQFLVLYQIINLRLVIDQYADHDILIFEFEMVLIVSE